MKTRLIATLFAFLIATLPALAKDWSKVAKQLAEATIQLQAGIGHKTFCSGWMIDNKRDYVMTAEHCLGWTAEETFVEGKPYEVLWSDTYLDAAVLRVPGLDKRELRAQKRAIRVGQEAAFYGFAREWGLYSHFRAGNVSGIGPIDELPGDWVIIDNSGIGGMSGGPIVDSDGKVISMVQRSDRRLVQLGRSIEKIFGATKKFWR